MNLCVETTLHFQHCFNLNMQPCFNVDSTFLLDVQRLNARWGVCRKNWRIVFFMNADPKSVLDYLYLQHDSIRFLIINQTYFTETVVSIEAVSQCISLKRGKWRCFHVPTTQLCTPSFVILDKPWKVYTMNVHVVSFSSKMITYSQCKYSIVSFTKNKLKKKIYVLRTQHMCTLELNNRF